MDNYIAAMVKKGFGAKANGVALIQCECVIIEELVVYYKIAGGWIE